MEQYWCPNCRASIQPLRRSRDFFCRACYTSLVVIDDHWVQMMRANDKIPQNIPFSTIQKEGGKDPLKPDHRRLTGPLS
jgi:hypothetical protein